MIEVAILLAGFAIATALASRFAPRWAPFIIEVLIAVYFLLRVVVDEPSLLRVAALAMAALFAFHIWWRDLREASDGHRP